MEMEMKMEMEIKHFSHEHPLILLDKKELMKSWLYCAACGVRCKAETYGCRRCRVFLHKSCAELKQQIQNPFHPHPLTLLPQEDPIKRRWFTCNACLKPCPRFIYFCNLCNLCLDVKCAFVIPTFEGDEQLQHYSHLHPLTLSEKKLDDKVYCCSCGKWCWGPTYGCSSCKFFLHRSCADLQLPQQIQHFFHPCPLTLCTKTIDFTCKACYNCRRGFYFHCRKCNFMLDVDCALLPTMKYKDGEQIYHFSHRHPLNFSEIIDDHKVYCSACQKRCSGRTYVCGICEFFIEGSCLKWQREIRHPFHPSHPLTLLTTINPLELIRCNACRRYCYGFTFHCNLCNFYLHVECSELMPTIKYEAHSHNLTLMEKRSAKKPQCNACKTPCEPPMLKCMDCNFSLHLLCGPLPYTIKDKCHIDPLTLTDSPVDDDWNGFYCDVCEKERDPRPSVYYCGECHFIAEVSCVISEVMLSLKGERGDVELRTSATQIAGTVINKSSVAKRIWQKLAEQDSEIDDTMTEGVDIMPALTPGVIFNSLTEDEKLELNCFSVVLQKEMVAAGEMLFDDQKDGDSTLENDQNADDDSIEEDDENGDGDITQKDDQNEDGDNTVEDKQTEAIESIIEDSLFSDEAYTNFMEMLDSGMEISLKFWKYEEVVKVGDYMVTRNMASILEHLYAKYGDISAESKLSPRVKMFFFVMLCGTIYSMRNTKVVDISENLLRSWWNCLKTLQSAGFQVQFAFDHLKRVARAWFGLQVRKTVDDTLSEFDGDITKISKDIEKLTTKLEGLKRRRELVISAELAKSSTVDECLREASELKWRAAGMGLL